MSDASTTGLVWIPEAEWGVTGGSGQTLRMTSEDIDYETDVVSSKELRTDRQTPDWIRTGVRGTGGVDGEWSYGTYDDVLESVFMENWAGSVLTNGVTPVSGSLQKHFADQTSFQYDLYAGCMVTRFQRTVRVSSINTVRFEFLSQVPVLSSSGITGAAATTTQVQNSMDHITAIVEGGAPTTLDLTEIGLTLNNNLREQSKIGQLGPRGIGMGTIEVTGRLVAYFDTTQGAQDFVAKNRNWTLTDFGWTETDTAGNSYTWDIMACYIGRARLVTPGINQDRFVEADFNARLLSGEGSTISVTRSGV